MSDLELKQQDELVNLMIVYYQAIIGGYKKSIEDAIAEIEREINSGQWSEATIYGMQKVVAIIRKHTKVGDDNEQTTN